MVAALWKPSSGRVCHGKPPHRAIPSPPFTSRQATFWFGVYLAITSVGLYAVPGLLANVLGLAEPTEPWIRVLAIPTFNLSAVCMAMARYGSRDLIRFYAVARLWVIPAMAVLVVAGLAPAIIFLFGVIDLACAGLTFWALASEGAGDAFNTRPAVA